MKTTHNKIKMTNPPTPPTVTAIFVIPLVEGLIAEGVVVALVDGVGKGGVGTLGLPSGENGNGAVNSVDEICVVREGGTFKAKSGG